MKTYTVDFHTDGGYAVREFNARSDKDALRKARAFAQEQDDELTFSAYDDAQPVNEIRISDAEGNEVAVWHADELCLRLAAADLREALEGQTDAAQAVIDSWERGDLAGAVNALSSWIAPARAALAKAKGSEQ